MKLVRCNFLNHRLAARLILFVAASAFLESWGWPLYAQSYWEMTPYQIVVAVAVDPQIPADTRLAEALPEMVTEQVDRFVGAPWRLEVSFAARPFARKILSRMDRLTQADIEPLFGANDKVVVLGVAPQNAGYRVTAREYDIRTQTWGGISEATVAERLLLGTAIFDALWNAFAPIAQIDVDPNKNIILRPRAGGLPMRDNSLQLVRKDELFQPVTRKLNRQGKVDKGGILSMPWTFLVVEKVEGIQAFCKTHSGLRQALGTKRRGQSEQLAIAVRPLGNSTVLTVQSRGKNQKPLPGYDVYTQTPGSKGVDLVGRTDGEGRVTIPVNETPVQVLYVKGGGMLLARLPMVPGLVPAATAEVADDDVRLEFEGFLISITDNMIDLVARREILMARIRNRMEARKLDDAEKFFDELRRLPTREQIALSITEAKEQNASKDPGVQAKLDRLAIETQKTVAKFLDPRPIDALRSELNAAASGTSAQIEKSNPAATAAGGGAL